jgi:sulfate permease, SulP family
VAVIIISSMIALVDIKAIRNIYKFDRIEFVFAMTAMFGVLFLGILEGIFLGVGITLLILLYRISRPNILVLGRIPGTTEYTGLNRSPDNISDSGVLVLRLDSPLMLPNVSMVKEEVRRQVKDNKPKLVVFSMRSSPCIYLPATDMLGMLHDELRE